MTPTLRPGPAAGLAALLSLAIGLGPGAGTAAAYVVDVNGVRYDVTTFTGDYNSNASRFTTAEMPWWGSSALAQTFATAVDNNVGVGPNFAYSVSGAPFFEVSSWGYREPPAETPAGIYNFTSPRSESNNYAIASVLPTPAPTPGPLPLLGAAAAFGFSRRLRRRTRQLP
jgi:hypothetical protein